MFKHKRENPKIPVRVLAQVLHGSNRPGLILFSFDEMVRYDLPAMINYVLEITGKEYVWYIGHSQGSLIGFAAFSANQNLANKVFFPSKNTVKMVSFAQEVVSDIKFMPYYAEIWGRWNVCIKLFWWHH